MRRRAPQYKKHKTWDGDSVIAVTPTGNGFVYCTLYDGEGHPYVATFISHSKLADICPCIHIE